MDRLYDVRITDIRERLGNHDGLVMFNKICEAYQVGPDQTLAFFNADGQEQLIDHPLNTRIEETTIEEYAESVERHGNVSEVRGAPFVQLSADDKPPYMMITYRQLSKAVYVAYRRSPRNPVVAGPSGLA